MYSIVYCGKKHPEHWPGESYSDVFVAGGEVLKTTSGSWGGESDFLTIRPHLKIELRGRLPVLLSPESSQ